MKETIIAKNKVRFRNAVKASIAALSDEDLRELSESLRRVQAIMGSIYKN